jgi:hypothetical protein
MTRQRIWITAAIFLAVIWSVVTIVMQQTDDLVSWPGKVLKLIDETPWLKGSVTSHDARQRYMIQVVTNYNRLDPSQRKALREDAQELMNKFFTSLTEEEQKEYVNRTVEPLLDTIDKGLKAMPLEERKKLIGRMRGDMKGQRGEPIKKESEPAADKDREFMESMIADDPIMFLREAPLETKMDLAPMLEEMYTRVQGFRR